MSAACVKESRAAAATEPEWIGRTAIELEDCRELLHGQIGDSSSSELDDLCNIGVNILDQVLDTVLMTPVKRNSEQSRHIAAASSLACSMCSLLEKSLARDDVFNLGQDAALAGATVRAVVRTLKGVVAALDGALEEEAAQRRAVHA